ncbi:MAG: hypothetical protein J6Q38_02005 [Clostridia bacterium]|nr:hypothetical protein [Clostridia bacterium]
MTTFYTKSYLKNLKKKIDFRLSLILAVIGITLIINLGMIIFFANQPYGSGLKNIFQIFSCVISTLTVIFCGLYYSILYQPSKKYLKSIESAIFGKKDKFTASVLRFNNELFNKGGVDYYRFDVLAWSDVKKDYAERSIFYDVNIPINLQENQMVEVVVSANILLGFEVIK